MSEDEDPDIQLPVGYGPLSPVQELRGPLTYLAGFIPRFPRLSTLVSINLLAINLDSSRSHGNHFRGAIHGYIGNAEDIGQATAYHVEPQTILEPDSETPRSSLEATPNSKADYDIYYDQLLLYKRGCPLYSPGPSRSLPIDYRKTGTRIGDIGIVYRSGFFDYLFNILVPADDPINIRVPPGFRPFDFAPAVKEEADGQAFGPGSFLSSACMRKRSSTSGALDSDFIFETTENEGAVLVLPGGSTFMELLNKDSLKTYIMENADSWYSYIRLDRGRGGVGDGDVRLVVGFDKAYSWGIATFACSQEPGRLEFRRRTLSGSFGYTWHCPEGIGNGKSGPLDHEIRDLRASTDEPPPENQTMFLRTLNFSLGEIVPDEFESVALQVRPCGSRMDDPSNSVLFGGNSSALSSNQSPYRAGGSQVGQQRGVNFHPTHFELPIIHPSTYLNQFLLKQYPNAKIAITDDWDWISVIREDDFAFPSPKDLCQRIVESCQVSEENGIVTIIGHGPSTEDHPSVVNEPTAAISGDDDEGEEFDFLRKQCVLSALADSVERDPPPRCAPSTRQEIMAKIQKWAKNTSSNNTTEIFWLTGGVGAGKTAVAQSVAEVAKKENILAASFFFNSASNLTKNGGSLIPTLVFQLLEVVPGLRRVVGDCINSNRDLFSNLWDVQKVNQKLFIDSLQILHLTEHILPPLMVIDGLDECHDPEFQCELLRSIAKALLEVPYTFRLLIASRSEDHLVKIFDHDSSLQMITVHRCDLSDDPDSDRDIRDFLEQQLEEIKQTHPFRTRLPTGWPGEAVLRTLVDRSSQHFIYASTVVDYIQSPKYNPDGRLRVILDLSPPATKYERPFAQLDFLYSSMFQAMGHGELQDLHCILGLRRVIDDSFRASDGFFQWQNGSEFLFFESSPDSGYRTPLYIIETLLKMRRGDVKFVLSPLRSLVSLGDRDVRVLHKSLFEYLLDSSRSGDFHLNLSLPHRVVTRYIVENWVSFKSYPFAGPTQFTNKTRDDILAYHLKASGLDVERNAPSIISKGDFSDYPIFREPPPAYHSIGSPTFNRIPLPTYQSVPDPSSPTSQQIPDSAEPEFLPVLRRTISLLLQSTSHSHSNSRQIHTSSDKPPVPSETEREKQAWAVKYNPDLRPRLDITFVHAFVHHEAKVYSVKFSPDGYYLAIGLRTERGQGRVFIYDVRTGMVIRVLAKTVEASRTKKTSGIRSVCFSPDSRYCVFGDLKGKIKVWVIASRRIRNAFVGHTSAVTSLDFSPNGRLLVSASLDGSIRIWNIRDGFTKILTQNGDYFYSAKFSPNGQYIAAANIDKIIRTWHVGTARLVDWWDGNAGVVDSIAFIPNGMGLISGNWDRTVRYWDVSPREWSSEVPTHRRREILKFVGHNDLVFSVAISPDGRWVLSGSRDGGISVWDFYDATQQCDLQGHKGAIWSVDFSPAGNYLAVGGHDGQVSLWKYQQIDRPDVSFNLG